MSAPVSASVYESLAGCYWSAAHHERAIAERCRDARAWRLAMQHTSSAVEAEQRARAAEESARYLWDHGTTTPKEVA